LVNAKKLEQFHTYARGNELMRFIPTAYRVAPGESCPRGSDRGGALAEGLDLPAVCSRSSCNLVTARLRYSCSRRTAQLRSGGGEASRAPQ
jgi:hypothetical protein